MKLSADIQEITSDVQHSKSVVESMMDEHIQSCSALSDIIAVSNSNFIILELQAGKFL